MLAVVVITLHLSISASAQLPCLGVTTDCVEHPSEPETYKCIIGPANVSTLTSGSNPLLLPQVQAANTAQRIVIKGTLTVDIATASGGYTFFEGSEIVLADASSEIVVTNGCGLKLNRTSVHGCNSMWNRIFAQPGATLILENQCDIRDGITSIEARNNTNVSISNSYFNRNLTAVKLGWENFTIKQPINCAIWGNTFSGSEMLKTPFANIRPLIGIQVLGINNVNIGSWSGGQNLFTSFHNFFPTQSDCRGIYVSLSNVTISNSRFNFMAETSTRPSDGAVGAENGSTLVVQGFGAGEAAVGMFGHCKTGVYLLNSNADVSDAKFSDIGQGVAFSQSAGNSSGNHLKVNNSRFVGFYKQGITVSRASGALNLSMCELLNCTFDDNSVFVSPKTAINVACGMPAFGNHVKVNGNKFYLRDRGTISDQFNLLGVNFVNMNGGSGEYNEFYDYGPDNSEFTAMAIQSCNAVRWANNLVIGNNSDANGDGGFVVDESPNCAYNCNYLDGVRYGMTFYGMCNSSALYPNNFNNHNRYGLYLAADGTVIGGQFRKYNTWGGTPGSAEAYMSFANYNPNFQNHAEQVKKSIFTIHTPNQNTEFWANPRLVGLVMGNDPHWFVEPPTPTPLTINLCPEVTVDPDDPRLDFGEKSIVNGTFIPWQGYPANTWDAALLLYKRMEKDPSLRPYGTPEATWFANQYNGNLGKIARVYEGFVSLSSDAPIASASQLLTDLNTLTLNTVHEQNMKTVLSIFLEMTIAQSEQMSQQQTDALNTVADQCRYEGGVGVVLARLALGQSSRREGDCSQEWRGSEERAHNDRLIAVKLNATVFPNPAEQSFSVRLDQNLQNGALCLVNLQGQTTRVWKFYGNTIDISDADASPGVYFLEVRERGITLSRNKVVFNR